MGEYLVHNERVKLQAAVLNGLAIACFITAFIQNVFVNGLGSGPQSSPVLFIAVSIGFGLVGLMLHFLAVRILGELKEKSVSIGVSNDAA